MIQVRKSQERGHFNHGWLDTYHSFSFADYHDPEFMGYRNLRVINEDRVAPGEGFPMHSHQNMEIITYILSGTLEHKDSMENGSLIKKGDVQRMSAGTGVTHSEFNPSQDEQVHLLQIWILPEKKGIEPSYEQQSFRTNHKPLQLIASPKGEGGSIKIHQDARVYISKLENSESIKIHLDEHRFGWIQVAKGAIRLDDEIVLDQGDGVSIEKEKQILINATKDAEVLIFDLN